MEVRFRIQGLDTPETYRRTGSSWSETTGPQREFGVKATNLVRDLLKSAKSIFFKTFKSDKYNRRISRFVVDGKDIAEQVIRSGLGIMKYLSLDPRDTKYYTPDTLYYNALVSAQEFAKRNGFGFWASGVDLSKVFPPRR